MGFPTILVALAGLSVVGGNTEDATANATARWVAQVNARLDNSARMDREIMPRHVFGVAALAFYLGEDGRVRDVRIVRSSGNAWVDRRAVERLGMVGRLPQLPATRADDCVYALVQVGGVGHSVSRSEHAAELDAARLAVREDVQRNQLAQSGRPTLLVMRD